MRMLRVMSGVMVSSWIAGAQPAETPPAFEVASVRVSQATPGGRHEDMFRERIQPGPGSLTIRGASLRSCIRWAYHVMDSQVTGPDWIGQQRYDIVAKAPAAADEDQLRLMLQTLLAERFKLAVHRQTKEAQAWVLSVGKGGPKFRESTTDGEGSIQPDMKQMAVVVQRTPVSQLVDMLSNVLRAPVVDETGLKGKYDLTLRLDKYVPDPATPVDVFSTVMNVIQQELGLKIEQRRVQLDYIVVDHAEKAPVEN